MNYVSNYNHYMWRRRILLALLYLKHEFTSTGSQCKRFWVRNIYLKRKQQGDFHNLIQEMRLNDGDKFFNYFRMSSEQFDILLSKVMPEIEKIYISREPISPAERLSVTLRFLASGDSMTSLSYAFRLGKTTISNIIKETCIAIWNVLKNDAFLKPSEEEWLRISQDFENQWNLPHCIGAIDGKHVAIQAPPHSGSDFYNYKGSHSIILMAVCDASYCFTIVDIGAKGRQSDGGVFRHSQIGQKLENGTLNIPPPSKISNDDNGEPIPYYLVGDEAFPLAHYMMRPYPGRLLSQEKRIFNYRLSRSRRVAENTFGVLAARWRVYRKPLIASLETAEAVVMSTICLHNFLMRKESNTSEDRRHYCNFSYVDHEDANGSFIEGQWRAEGQYNNLEDVRRLSTNTYTRMACSIRDSLAAYFMFEGAVDFQWHLH
ncbi:hypothetical protein NQ314_007010 [Rhamnusium bicolor]|uniref:DDE Tnp4 domain-containing protein n=1 Tax=Rhamnusium bicolor TaxID=1586634 RepID=A0AAV8XU04_9CUCU|nr:hypothetical protein NQ314_010091 [Rhamnusium bicolor]KAJ8954819.1 hypothetical protein NQ314_007010 [Rhamnusium bicolor]